MSKRDTFDPENVDKESMKLLAEHIEGYIEFLESIMIIPEDIKEEYGETINKGILRSKKLIKKLKKGNMDVFNDKINDL